MPTDKVTVKLYPLEYHSLYGHLAKIFENVRRFGLNSSAPHLLLYDFFWRKAHILSRNANNNKGKMRSLSLKPHEARALYDELRIYSNDIVIGQIFGHLDRAMVNLGFKNQQV